MPNPFAGRGATAKPVTYGETVGVTVTGEKGKKGAAQDINENVTSWDLIQITHEHLNRNMYEPGELNWEPESRTVKRASMGYAANNDIFKIILKTSLDSENSESKAEMTGAT